MEVRKVEVEGVRVVEVTEQLNDGGAAMLAEMDGLLEGARVVVLDFAGLEQIGSAGVGNILRLKTRLGIRGATLRLAALRPGVEDVLRKARADQVMEMFDDVGVAVVRRVSAG